MSDRAWESPSGADRLPPEVPDFELTRLIGEGGFGQVWLATNRATGRLRAVKVIPLRSSGTTDPAGREITSITRLEANFRRQHLNLSTIHHVGKTADHLYYVMDPADDVSGGPPSLETDYRPATLQNRLETGRLPPEQCLRYARQLLAGLAFLHEAGMVHRDVKPANCLFVDGQLKLADFGLLTEANPQMSRLGTLKYMPHDGRMDARADVYAAGLVIYEMITGLPADGFPRPGERVLEAVEDPILCVLNHLALRACQRDPLERFRDARQMLRKLEAGQREAASAGTRSRRRVITAVTGLVVASSLAGLGIWASRWRGVHVNFITRPFGATIYLDNTLWKDADEVPYRTPCTIEGLPPRVHHVQFRHDERDTPLDAGQQDFAKQRRIVKHWDSQP
ncbi:MAG: serine/threonine-protein kinase [Planctomycetota bacterium]|jgi:serine/threonine protein kinase